MYPIATPHLHFCLAVLTWLAIGPCSNLIAQEDTSNGSVNFDHRRRDLVPPGRGGGLYGNDLPFWTEQAGDFFTSKPMLQAADAITKRDQQRLQEAIQHVPNVDSPGRAGVTLLYWSYLQGNLEAFKFLLSRGACPDVAATEELKIDPTLGTGRTENIPLLSHAGMISSQRPGFFEAGLDYTKQPNQRDQFGGTFLHNWAPIPASPHQLQILRKLISLGVEVDAKNFLDATALQKAALHNPQAMLILMDAGADPNIPLSDGTPLIDLVRQCAKIAFSDPDYPKVLQRLDPPALSQAFTRSVRDGLELSDAQRAELKKLQSQVDQRLTEILSDDQLQKLRKVSP